MKKLLTILFLFCCTNNIFTSSAVNNSFFDKAQQKTLSFFKDKDVQVVLSSSILLASAANRMINTDSIQSDLDKKFCISLGLSLMFGMAISIHQENLEDQRFLQRISYLNTPNPSPAGASEGN